MTRFAASAALCVLWWNTAAEARQDSSSCPPVTSIRVMNVSATTYTMRISVRNTCTCSINFKACQQDRPKRCKSSRIGPGETRQLELDTAKSDGKANYSWACR
jgi:hypothetical protein